MDAPAPDREPPARPGRALLIYLLLTAALLHPLVLAIGSGTYRDDANPDHYSIMWILGRNWDRLASGQLSGFWEGNLLYPSPQVLAYAESMLGQTLIGAPIQALTGNLLVTYNLLLLGSFVATAWCSYLLLRRWSGHEWGALIGGLALAFSPLRFAHLNHLNVLTFHWVPLALLFLERFMDDGRARDLALAVACWVLQLVSCGYHGLGLAWWMTAWVLVRFACRRPAWDWARVTRIEIIGGIGLAIALLLIYPHLAIKRQLNMGRTLAETQVFSADLADYLATPPGHRLWGGLGAQLLGEHYKPEGALFPGVALLALAALGLAALWRDPQRRMLAGLLGGTVVVCTLLSFGPRIRWLGHELGWGPYAFVYRWIPGFAGLRAMARLAFFSQLALAGLAACGAASLQARWGRRALLACGLLALLECLHALPISPVPGAGAPRQLDRWLRGGQAPAGPLVELPLGLPHDYQATFHAAHHGRWTVNGITGYRPPWYVPLERELARFPSDRGVAWLRELGVQLIAVHLDRYAPEERRKLERRLARRPELEPLAALGDVRVLRLRDSPQLSAPEAYRRWYESTRRFPAWALHSEIGQLTDDAEAPGGVARSAAVGERGRLTLGPHAGLPSGRYLARVRLRIGPSERPAGRVRITFGPATLAERPLVREGPGWRDLELPFAISPSQHLQARVQVWVECSGEAAVAIASLELIPIEQQPLD